MPRLARNVIVVMGAVALYYAWWRVADAYGLAHPQKSVVGVDPLVLHVLLDIALGFGLYFSFATSRSVRVVLAASIPFLSGLLLEITVGSDPAYPLSVLLIAGLMVVPFLLGALLAAGLHAWHGRRSASVA